MVRVDSLRSRFLMSLHRFHIAAIATWFVALVVVLGIWFSLGAAVTPAGIFTVVLASCVPALVLLIVFRGAPRTIGQLLYETDNTPKDLLKDARREIR
jgi:hypothetical protein